VRPRQGSSSSSRMIRRLVMTPARAARGGAFVPRLPPRLGVAWRALSTAAPTPGELVAVDEEDVERVALDEVMSPKLPKGTRTGIVTSTKMDKTITVQFYKRKYVPKYDVYYNKKVKGLRA